MAKLKHYSGVDMTNQVYDFATFVKEFDEQGAEQAFEAIKVEECQKVCDAFTSRRKSS